MVEPWPTVSVVIPTVMRPTLLRAVRSVRDQDYRGRLEIIVVDDGPGAGASSDAELSGQVDQLVTTGGGQGGARARNLGMERATGDLVAFLDDDDVWDPAKIARQVDYVRQHQLAGPYVLSSRVRHVGYDAGDDGKVAPTRLVGPGQQVADYLFLRRTASTGREVLYTSTLLLPRVLAQQCQWTVGLRRHQDWDWLMKLQRDHGARIHQLPSADVAIWTGSEGSISAGTNWQSSLEWIDTWRPELGTATYVDFVAGQPLRYALAGRSVRGVLACVRAMVRVRRLPHLGPVVIGLSGLLGRGATTKLLTSSRRGAASGNGSD